MFVSLAILIIAFLLYRLVLDAIKLHRSETAPTERLR
jgi:hypothetical protein